VGPGQRLKVQNVPIGSELTAYITLTLFTSVAAETIAKQLWKSEYNTAVYNKVNTTIRYV